MIRPVSLARFSALCALAAVGLALGAGGVAGASSGNGIASKSASEIVTIAAGNTQRASSFTLNGQVTQGSTTINLINLSLSDSASQGSIAIRGAQLQLRKVNNTIYMNGSSTFWTRYAGSTAAQLLGGRWFYGSASSLSSSNFSSLAGLMTPKSLTANFAKPGTLNNVRKGSTSAIAGQKVISVSGRGKSGGGGTLYVSTTGKPYIVRIVATQTTSRGSLTFTNYDKPVNVHVPPNAISIANLQHHGGSGS